MTLPVLEKTWQFLPNVTVAALVDLTTTNRRIYRTLKDQLKAFGTQPWTVVGSGNAVSVGIDAVDRWAADSDIITAPGAHSWIVLKQTGVASNFQVCIDLNSSNSYQCTIVVSANAGFTGGTTTARPTATDEYVLLSAGQFLRSANVQQVFHLMQSTDGQCTRIVGCSSSTIISTFLMFDKPSGVVSGWTNPHVACAKGVDTGEADDLPTLASGSLNLRSRSGTTNFSIGLTAEALSTGLLPTLTDVGNVVNSFDSSWPFFTIGVASTTLGAKGRSAYIVDLWWKPSGVSNADTFPTSTSTRQFAALGGLIFPWVGDTTTPALA